MEYLTNGDFESGDFSGWGVLAPTNTAFVAPTTAGYGAENGKFMSGPPALQQPLSLAFSFRDLLTMWARC